MGRLKQRAEKRAAKWKKAYKTQRELHQAIKQAARDILESENFSKSDEFIQHGTMTVKNHSMNVAKYSLFFSEKLPIQVNRKELIRGALLHDYFLYDWHTKCDRNEHKRLHGFYHPGIALRNARREYRLTKREQDIIKKHMWPLTVVPPACREAWIVTAADKYCSLLETLRIHRGHGIRGRKRGITVPAADGIQWDGSISVSHARS